MIRLAPLLLAALMSCAKKAPPPTPAAAVAPLPPEKKAAAAAVAMVPTCARLLDTLDDVPLGPQLDDKPEIAVVAALARCEQVLVPLLSPGDKEELARGRALYSLSFANVPDEEIFAYAAILHRFAIATEMRRVLHFGPSLLRLFAMRTPTNARCGMPEREAALFYAITPKSMGGDSPRGARYFADALKKRPACSRDFVLAAEIARLSFDVPAALEIKALVNALVSDDLVDKERTTAMKNSVKQRLATLLGV